MSKPQQIARIGILRGSDERFIVANATRGNEAVGHRLPTSVVESPCC
jgi:hypothetical protein